MALLYFLGFSTCFIHPRSKLVVFAFEMSQMKRHTESMEYYVDMFGVKSWHLWFYMASFTAISFFMMTGTILAWVGRPLKTLTSLNTWFHLPVFLVLVTLLWTLLSFYSVGLVMTAGK
jgi:hypothetical protein